LISEVADFKNVLLHEVWGDTVLPNFVQTAPLSGTEPMIRAGRLAAYSSTRMDPEGIDGTGRFVPPATHSSLLSPAASPAATMEMQKQMASFVAWARPWSSRMLPPWPGRPAGCRRSSGIRGADHEFAENRHHEQAH
jgi:hypothetical protein